MTANSHKRPPRLDFRALRLIAIVLPILFAVAVGLFSDLVLEEVLPHLPAHLTATIVFSLAVVVFAGVVFALLERAYRRLEEQEEAERQSAEEWKELFETGREITASPDLQGLLDAVVRRARRLLGSDAAFLLLSEDGGEGLRMAAADGLGANAGDLLPAEDEAVEALVVQAGEPVAVENQLCDTRIPAAGVSFTAREGFLSRVSVPLAAKGRLLGTLTVANRPPTRFDERQVELLSAFANWAAVAVETSRLYAQVEGLARMEERERIGMELHDAVIQSIYGVQLNLQACLQEIESSPQSVCRCLDVAIEDLDKVVAYMRRYIFGLRPYLTGSADLPRALRDLVEDMRVNTTTQTDLQVQGDVAALLDEEQAQGLFLIAQEALTNTARHAAAGTAQVKLVALPGEVLLDISDDGRGFDPDDRGPGEERGLRRMAGRAEALGGGLSISSANGGGTRICVRIPVGERRG